MATVDFMPVKRLPVLSIPDIGAEEEENSLRFRIVNSRGVINVTGRGDFWRCAGSADALAMAGMLEIVWLPGSQGNNKVSQTVCFGNGGPELYRGNPRGRRLPDSIQIKRISAKLFEVTIPATADQVARFRELNNKFYERLREKRARESIDAAIDDLKAKLRSASPDDVVRAIQFNYEAFRQYMSTQMEVSGLLFDAVSERVIDQHMKALQAAFQRASMYRAPSEFTGNVVPFAQN